MKEGNRHVKNLSRDPPKVHPKFEENLASSFGEDIDNILNELCHFPNEKGKLALPCAQT